MHPSWFLLHHWCVLHNPYHRRSSCSEEEAKTQPAPSLPPAATLPLNWIRVPQRGYDRGRNQSSFKRLRTVYFSVDGRPGINVGDALRKTFKGLDGRDDPVLQDAAGAISCRFLVSSSGFHEIFGVDSVHPQFPGYPGNGGACQV
jgi:hypothetical protein